MSFLDADQLAENETLRADLCVVGAGAAGIALALELESSGLRVILLESGDAAPLAEADALNELGIAGHPLNVDVPVRRRCLGGTTVATYGRSVVLDPIDFEDRPWLGASGWPIAEPDVRHWYPQAARILGLPRPDLLFAAEWAAHPVARLAVANDLAVRVHRWGRHVDLGHAWSRRLRCSEHTRVLLRATAVECAAEPGRPRIARLSCRGLNGGRFTVEAGVFVLACGGFENPRLLLLSRHGRSPPAINWDPVGRFYMNHPRCEGEARVTLDTGRPQVREWARRLVMHREPRARGRLQFSFSPAEALQRREGLLNSTTFFFAVSDARARAARDAARNAGSAWAAARSAARSAADAADLPTALAATLRLLPRAPTLAAGAWHALKLQPYRPVELVAVDQCEQPPQAESRITLGRAADRFGCPRIELDWRIDAATTASLRRLHRLLGGMFDRLGVGRFGSRLLDDPGYEPRYTDCAHPTGATRMSRSDHHGVVDADCRVHGLQNLFVVGSSVFPVGGQANPTLAIIALAARLAAHLRSEWGRLTG